MDDISIIIRCRNEESHIGFAIQSCLDNFNRPEIIFVNNQSTDDSSKVVDFFAHDTDLSPSPNYTDIKTVSISNYSPGRALNLGVQSATRKYILLLSSHCIIRRFSADIYPLLDQYQAVFGNQQPIYYGKKILKRYLWSHFHDSHDLTNLYSQLEQRYFLHNAFCFYKRDQLLEHPFDPNLVGKEDRYWANSLIHRGGSFLYKHDILAEHIYTPNGNTWKGVG